MKYYSFSGGVMLMIALLGMARPADAQALIGGVIGLAAGAYGMSNTGCGADASDRGCAVAVVVYTTFLGTVTGALVGAVADIIIPHASHPSDGAARLATLAVRRSAR